MPLAESYPSRRLFIYQEEPNDVYINRPDRVG